MFKIKELENFAVIEKLEDELELKDLTIFMGDNSAGKSYLAMLIHSFVNFSSEEYRDNKLIKKFKKISILENSLDKIKKVDCSDITTEILFREKELLELEKIIYFSIGFLLKKYFVDLKQIDIELTNLKKFLLIIISKNNQGIRVEISLDNKIKIVEFPDYTEEKNYFMILSNIIKLVIEESISEKSVYLIASRAAYLQTYQILNQVMLNKKNPLSIITQFFISQLNNNTNFEDNKFSKYIENLLLGGKVNIYQNSNDINFELKNGEKIDINNLSSTVSELIPLVVFLKRGLIRENGLVVIEEPEAHLSFKNQKLIAKLIALLVNNKIKVLITTHSDFLIYELNNLIMKDKIFKYKKELGDKIDKEILEDDITLDYKKVGVYNFLLKENGKSTVKRVEINEDGVDNRYIFDSTYDMVMEKDKLLDLMDLING